MSDALTPHWRVLVIAKAPVPGLAKTRLAADVGDEAAADLAAAALLDTLAAVAEAVPEPGRRHVATTGDWAAAARAEELLGVLDDWQVHDQRGEGFDERLAHAHADCGPGPLVQIGSDTPQVTAALLAEVAAGLDDHDAVLAPADDGGWWALALRDPADAVALVGVPMSADDTGDATRAALTARGLSVGDAPSLVDVDTSREAGVVADLAPGTRFAARWATLRNPSKGRHSGG